MTATAILSAEQLRSAVHYDPETGVFTRLKSSPRVKAGDRADVVSYRTHGKYRRVSISGNWHWAHRLAFLYVLGECPSGEIDHIDGDSANNKISNLRIVTRGVNQQNQRKPYASNKTGYLGVQLVGERFRASISLNGRCKKLGMFDTPEEAHAAYLAAKREYHEGCTI